MRAAELVDAMVDRGLVPADAELLPFGAGGRPWYVTMVLGGAGWLASLFGFLFVVLLFEPDTTVDFMVAGIVMLGAGYGLYVVDRDSAFFEQLALALSLAGQIALIGAMGQGTDSAFATAAFAALLSAALLFALPNHFVKVISTSIACIAWALAVRLGWWGEDSLFSPDEAVALAPALAGWLLIWLPVAGGAHVLIEREAEWMATGARRVARPALTGLLLALAAGTWTSEPFAAFPFGIQGTVTLNWLAIWPLLGAAAALFAAVCAFRIRHRAMLGVAIAGALLHLVHFYYLLGVRLVTKSYVMLAVGVVLLLAARRLRLGEPVLHEPPAAVPSAATTGSDVP